MASPAKKAKVDDEADDAPTKRPCPYGASCYRKNPAHFVEFSHPKDGSTTTKVDGALDSSSLKASLDDIKLPPCKYGAKCYRKNLLHFAEFSHPTLPQDSTSTTSVNPSTSMDCDGSDTDRYDSDDDDQDKARDKVQKGGDGTNGQPDCSTTLVKSFSQMTEAERKELIRKAFEAKQKLMEELEATRKERQRKDQKLLRLQEEVNQGILQVEGEDEALKGDITVYFPLMAERNYKEGSADQIHFRLAESQFYRLLSGEHSKNFRVTSVEYVVTPHLVKRFKEAQKTMRRERGEDQSYPVLAFHGTDEINITPICENGFKVPGTPDFVHKTDTGFYGAGVYFSEYPSYSMGYINGANKLLLCQVLPGKVFKCTVTIHGAKLEEGYDSHMSPCKRELIIFNPCHILPCYVVHYATTTTEFCYQKFIGVLKKSDKSLKISHKNLTKKRKKAWKVSKSSVFNDLLVKYVGPKTEETSIVQLVTKHKGQKGTNYKFDIVIAHEDKNDTNSKVIQKAMDQDVPVVTEEYLYECIVQQQLVDKDLYLHDVYTAN